MITYYCNSSVFGYAVKHIFYQPISVMPPLLLDSLFLNTAKIGHRGGGGGLDIAAIAWDDDSAVRIVA